MFEDKLKLELQKRSPDFSLLISKLKLGLREKMTNKISKISIPLVLVILFFLFLPFERLLTVEVFGLTAKISFLVLMLIILAMIVYRPKPKLAAEEKILLLFVLVSYLTTFWSIDQLRSLIVSTIYLATFVGFIALRRFLDQRTVGIVKSIIICWGLLLALFALWQYFADLNNLPWTFLRSQYTKIVFGFPRPQATFLEPLYFANFLFLPLFFTIERILYNKKIRAFLLVNLFLLMLVLVLTLSRGAYFAFAFAAIVLTIIIAVTYKNYLRRFWLAVAIGVFGVIAGILLIYFTVPRENFSLFVTHAGVADVSTGESTLDRFYFAGVAWENFLQKPWGIGAGAFGALPDFSNKLLAGNYQTVGNLYLEVLVEEGIISLLLFAAFIFLLLRHLWKSIASGKPEGLIYLSILLAILVQAISFSSLYIIPIWAFLALAWPKTTEKLKN